jgi:stringent starvation protein B
VATTPAGGEGQGSSTRPYLIRALHDWCTDNGFTPYVAVYVDAGVRVPMEYVKNHEIVLNIGFEATTGLKLGNDWIEFRARFGGVARDIAVPVDHVVAIYARENGQGMAFPVPTGDGDTAPAAEAADDAAHTPRGLRLAKSADDEARDEPSSDDPPPPDAGGPGSGARPSLKRVK